MHLGKLTHILSCLDKAQMLRLSQYIHSPYFNIKPAAVQLFNYVKIYHPHFDKSLINHHAIKKISPALASAKTQSNMGTLLLKHIDDFMAIENLQNDSSALNYHALLRYKQQNHLRAFEELWQRAKHSYHNEKLTAYEKLWQEHLLTELRYSGIDAQLKREEENDLTGLLESLDVFYWIKKLYYLTEMQLRHLQFGSPKPQIINRELLQKLEALTPEADSGVFLTVQTYLMVMSNGFEEGLPHLKQIVSYAESKASKPEASLRQSINHLKRWCTQTLNRGSETAGEYLLWSIDYEIKHQLLSQNEDLEPVQFGNILIITYQVGRPAEWLKLFIQAYGPNLPLAHRETYTAFGMGLYYLQTMNYKKAIREFRKVQDKGDATFNALMRRWEFTAICEDPSGTAEDMLAHLEAFRKYIQRNKKRLSLNAIGFETFLYYGRKIVDQLSSADKKDLLVEVEAASHFPGKNWLMEYLNKKQKPAPIGTG